MDYDIVIMGTTFEEYRQLDTRDYAAHGGAFPIFIRDVGMGTIGACDVLDVLSEIFHLVFLEIKLTIPFIRLLLTSR